MTQRVVIIGGTSGIGLATARHQLDAGREVVVTGRDEDRLAAALDRLGGNASGHASGHAVDARDVPALTELFTRLGEVDHLVVTVTGPAGTTPFPELTVDDLRTGVEGKLLPHTASALAALPVLRPTGTITFISAASAGAAMPTTAALAAVNASIEAMVPVL